jgi:hypothetical protein
VFLTRCKKPFLKKEYVQWQQHPQASFFLKKEQIVILTLTAHILTRKNVLK